MKQLLEEIGKTNVCFKETPSLTNYNFLNLYAMLDKFSVTMFLAYVAKQLPQALWRLLDAEGPCIISFHSISCCRPQS